MGCVYKDICIWGKRRQAGQGEGRKNKHLEGVVIQGEFFCFRMKHAVVLSVGPER